MVKKQSFLHVFWQKMGFKRAKMDCNNRVFGCFLALFRAKSVPTVPICSTCFGGTVQRKIGWVGWRG